MSKNEKTINHANPPSIFVVPMWVSDILGEEYHLLDSFDCLLRKLSFTDTIKIAQQSERMLVCGTQIGESIMNHWAKKSDAAKMLKTSKLNGERYFKPISPEDSTKQVRWQVRSSDKGDKIVYIFMRHTFSKPDEKGLLKATVSALDNLGSPEATASNYQGLFRAYIRNL